MARRYESSEEWDLPDDADHWALLRAVNQYIVERISQRAMYSVTDAQGEIDTDSLEEVYREWSSDRADMSVLHIYVPQYYNDSETQVSAFIRQKALGGNWYAKVSVESPDQAAARGIAHVAMEKIKTAYAAPTPTSTPTESKTAPDTSDQTSSAVAPTRSQRVKEALHNPWVVGIGGGLIVTGAVAAANAIFG